MAPRCACAAERWQLRSTATLSVRLQIIQEVGDGSVAVATETARPPRRVLVDIYSPEATPDSLSSESGTAASSSASGSSSGGDAAPQLLENSVDLLTFLASVDVPMHLLPKLPHSRSLGVGSGGAGAAGAAAALRVPHTGEQSTNEVLMVAPTAFGFNEETAADNHFMHAAAHAGEGSAGRQLEATVCREFAGLHHELAEVHGAFWSFSSVCCWTWLGCCV